MSDSDSESGLDWEVNSRKPVKLLSKNDTVVALRPSELVYDEWSRIPLETRRIAGERMRICAFWLPLLLQREDPSTTSCWAFQIDLISSETDDLDMKHLQKIETMEAILRALEKGTMKRDQTKHVVCISNMFNLRSPEVLQDALYWLERTGEPGIRHRVMSLGHPHICFTALHVIFTEFAKYIQKMGSNLEKTMKALMVRPAEYLIDKSEEMKKKGNENFKQKHFDEAVKFYSIAIKYYPDNHIIYANRALCYIRCNKYLKAVTDGKRATLIKPLWAKGHYRYCEALFSLGEAKKALEANSLARSLCQDNREGIKDLEAQHQKFLSEMPEPKVVQPKKNQSKRAHTLESRPLSANSVNKNDPPPKSKAPVVKQEKQPVKNEKTLASEGSTKNSKPSKSELFTKNGKGELSTPTKKKPKNRSQPEEEEKLGNSKAGVCKELKMMVQDAHTALADLRSRNAEQAFRKALVLLETSTAKEIGLSTLDVLLLLYGHAAALTEIGQTEELGEAQRLLEKIKSFEERTFQCLVYYATGRVLLKENRFTNALEQFSDSLQTVRNQITPGKLTWPLTNEIVKETQPDYFKGILEQAIELCKFPPTPDAICRLEHCLGPVKAEIYLTDPDFKGYIRICCCQSCVIEYHMACWKSLKTSSFSDRNEKDFLQESCFTPDCLGKICSIIIFGPTGLPKCSFKAAITKPPTPKKPKVNQKCTSLKNLKSKDEHRLKRKQHKQSFQEKQTISDEILQLKEDSSTQSQQKAWLLYRDRVLLQISQNLELLRQETGIQVSALTHSLKPWLELDSSRGNQLARRILNGQQEPLESLWQVVELLLERKNRVWARVLIQLLSSRQDINPKLYKWASRLNNAGLDAAKSFIERYQGHLEQLDLALVLGFGPMMDSIIEECGTRPELFSTISLNTEYLKQTQRDIMRLFIWTLEEHRDQYLSCHPMLDEYFDMMDGHCSVLKKSDENQNNSPSKSRARKRKKGANGVIVWSGNSGQTQREEWDQDFFEDDTLSFLHPSDSFSVPSHLREQVADFEDQYNTTRHRDHYKSILDNNPDPAKESLYDYFAQILEEHGPLVAEDPLLVGELENFPLVAKEKIQEVGGFEVFLLESLRFIKMGRCIGLAKHAVTLQQARHGATLDDLDDIAEPDIEYLGLDRDEETFCVFPSDQNGYSYTQDDVHPILPNPYSFAPSFGVSLPETNSYYRWSTGGDQEQDPYSIPYDYGGLDLPRIALDQRVSETSSDTTNESILKKHAAVQTCHETMRSVAVNTEIHESFETCQGDMNKKQRHNWKLEQRMEEMSTGNDKVNLTHKEELTVLEKEVQEITTNIQVTNKELAMFQQKLEEEVKKDQKEKKANQEGLKALKMETEDLVTQQGSLSQIIREKKNSFDNKLNDFLELSNQSAAEKMSLEDEITRCKALHASATRRSHSAQVLVVESSRDQGVFGLYKEMSNAKALLSKLDEEALRYPTPEVEISRNSCRVNIQEVEKKISSAEAQFQEQLDQVKSGRRFSELISVDVNHQPNPPAAPVSVAAKQSAATPPPSASHSVPSYARPPAAASPQHKPPPRALEPAHGTVFEKAMEHLVSIFPDYKRSELMRFVQDFRLSSGGSLSNMSLQDMVGGVTQLIFDHQERLKAAKLNAKGRGSPAQCAAPVWQPLGHPRVKHSDALNVEDPCIICHDDMSPDDICVLECRHSFHNRCIRPWLKEQSTCPTCRDHALMPDDFPELSGRRRQAP
ncbi:E3 ubiquitin-protein ligase TTC3 isoform X2 [Eleginops maclovinus]|uniref:E3 ubiquitin-protein ligase TTC3 isoform X2 n=1 Tax=Eleginops maclovinus TaxID=56733 RepID=UPI003080E559